MPRTAPSNSLLKASETETLCTITLRDSEILRFAHGFLQISKGEYQDYLLEVGELKETTTPETDRISVSLSNIDDALGLRVASQLRTLELSDVLIEKLYAPVGNRADYALYHYFSGKLTGAETVTEKIDENTFKKYVTFDIIPKSTASDVSKADRTLSPSCAWKFKDPRTCGYIGPLTTCNQQLKSNFGCIRRLRTAQNGGWTIPETPTQTPPSGGGGIGTGIGDGSCFTAGTLVKTPDGEKPIEILRIGDRVISFNERTLEQKVEKIADVFKHTANGFYRFRLSNKRQIEVTPNHRFYSKGKWIAAEYIEFNKTEIYSSDGSYVTVTDGKFEAGKIEVFNFHVSRNLTYFAESAAVHNSIKAPV